MRERESERGEHALPGKCWLYERMTLRKASATWSSMSSSGGDSMVSSRKPMYFSDHWSEDGRRERGKKGGKRKGGGWEGVERGWGRG